MTNNPEVQRKAQAEIDAVIGFDRLPTLADRKHLPYVEALVKEVFRLNPVAPLGTLSFHDHCDLSHIPYPPVYRSPSFYDSR